MDDRGRVECPICGRWLLHRKNGLVRAHSAPQGYNGPTSRHRSNCEGWGMAPRKPEETQ